MGDENVRPTSPSQLENSSRRLTDNAQFDVRVLFGAESVTLFPGHDAVAGSARNRWPGQVSAIRETGRLIEVIVDAGSPIAALITPGSQEALGLAPGVPVTLTVKAAAVRVIPR